MKELLDNPTNEDLIEFAKEQCVIFPEDSYMGKYLRKTIKILQEDMQEIVDKKVEEMLTRKKGHWINKSHTSGCGIEFVASECTCCGKKTFFNCDELIYKYCPNCGAEMRK